MTTAALNTYLDYLMILAHGTEVQRELRADDPPRPYRSGDAVARGLCGRLLLHYVTEANVGRFRQGRADACYVTPTALSPEDTVDWLRLPAPSQLRRYALLLRPDAIEWIQGPMQVAFSRGIQYILPAGFPKEAVFVPGAPDSQWECVIS